MRIEELVRKFNFHDSLLEDVSYLPDQDKVIMVVDFCRWLQSDYVPGSLENETIRLVFSGVRLYNSPIVVYDNDSILELHIHQNTAVFCVLNDNTHNYYEVTIEAESVEFKEQSD